MLKKITHRAGQILVFSGFVLGNFAVAFADGLQTYILQTYGLLQTLFVPFAVLMVLVGGVMIMVGGASSESASNGKQIIIDALSGLALFFLLKLILIEVLPSFFNTGTPPTP